jgi:fructose-1,6-bisphosphatase
MDLHAHQTFVDALRECAAVGSVLSEESAEPIAFDRIDGARYVRDYSQHLGIATRRTTP